MFLIITETEKWDAFSYCSHENVIQYMPICQCQDLRIILNSQLGQDIILAKNAQLVNKNFGLWGCFMI